MWKITNKTEQEAEILLYDIIGSSEDGHGSAKKIITQIQALGEIAKINLRINSVGGDVFEAQAVYSYLKSHNAKIEVRIDGIAASAASLIAMAGDVITMPENALMMIHNPAGGCYGEAAEMLKLAEILDKIRETLASVYVARTGLDREKILAMMDSETWLTAQEAQELGFCDKVEKAAKIAAVAMNEGVIVRNILGAARLDNDFCAELKNKAKFTICEYTQNTKGESEMKIENTKELEANYSELVSKIRDEATLAERERLKLLDSLNSEGCEEIITKAKYEEPKDARDVAMEILTAKRNQAQINALHSDARPIDDVLIPQKTIRDTNQEEQTAINSVVNEIKRMRGIR